MSYPPVPYVNQIDNAPRHNECGLACCLMLSRWNGLGYDKTVTQLSQKYDPTDDGTTSANLAQCLKDLGLTPTAGTAAAYPYIELVQYSRLPVRFDPSGNFLHWIVRLSDTEYHDPYWRGTDGANIKTTKAILDRAEQSVSARVGIVERPANMTKVNATVLVDVRLRTGPEVSDATWTNLGLLAGNKISGELVAGGFVKYKDDRYAIYDRNKVKQEFGYVVSEYGGIKYLNVTPITDPPIPQPSGFKLGVSVLGAHHLLEPAYASGIRSFLIMDGVVAAVNFKRAHPDAIVMYRRFLPQGSGIPSASAFSAEAGMGNGIVFVSPLNECDNWCYGTVAEIEARAKFDTELARMCKASGTIYASGGFSMGTPDFTKPEICEAMRKFYAPGYNSGLFAMNMHTYSPTMGWIYGESKRSVDNVKVFAINDGNGAVAMIVGRKSTVATLRLNEGKRGVMADPIGQRIWFERRWEFLFDSCGFDKSPNLLGIYSDETGIDEGGVGGFPAHGAGDAEIERWGREYVALSKLALNGGPSVMRAATIFQAGDRAKWSGYNVEGNFGAIARANQ